MIATPVYAPLPVMIPVVLPTDTANELLLQVPPADASLSVIVDPEHTDDGPDIADGDAFTATATVREQPDASV